MTSATPIIVEARDLRAVFERRGDRWHHRVEMQRGTEWIEVLQSIEGSENDVWPLSPTIQELHRQATVSGSTVALGVGMSGSSHWSLSSSVGDGANSLRFEIACRQKGAFHGVGTQYRLAPEAKCSSVERGLQLMIANQHLTIQLTNAGAVTFADEIRIDAQPTEDVPAGATARTVQWSYTIAATGI